jgi:hypothetical protein
MTVMICIISEPPPRIFPIANRRIRIPPAKWHGSDPAS